MRCKDVRKCSIGATGLYILYRFQKSGEMEEGNRPAFTDNSSWFDIKLLSEGKKNGADNTKEIGKRGYVDFIAKVLQELGIPSQHFGHWGRVNSPADMEKAELPSDEIRIIGKCVFDCLFYFISCLLIILFTF